MNEILKNKFPYAFNYFSQILELKKRNLRNFPQAIIFEGEDTIGQYIFATELARILNCQNDGDINCNCTNCKWIRSYTHPSITNVSQIHFKEEDDATRTIISAQQAQEIEKSLLLTSDYHRFFIFFSSTELKDEEEILSDYSQLNYKTVINHTIEPIDLKIFPTTSANALLKSIEEPPKNTTFVFLTKSKENIISTIVSRCLVFKLSGNRKIIDYSYISNLFSSYPNFDYQTALNISFSILNFIKENEIKITDALNQILEFFKDLIKNNIDNTDLIFKIRNDIKIVNFAIKMSKANMQNKIVIETMMLQLARGY